MQKFILIFCICISILSCSKEDSIDDNQNKHLLSELKTYNTNYKYEVDSNLNQAKWWNTLMQVAAIAGGDAAGAASGVWAAQGLAGVVGAATAGTGYAVVSGVMGLIGAVGGSYAAYCSTGGSCRASINETNPKGELIKYDFPTKFDYIEEFGVLHNDAILNTHLSLKNSEIEWIENNIENINEIDYVNLYNNVDFQNLMTEIKEINSNYKKNNYDINFLLNEYQSKGLINNNIKSILNLYFEATLKVNSFSDYKSITAYYVESINNSDLIDREKESLYAAFSVSIQSFYLWLNIEI